jgi:hypothetical protein
LNQAHCIYFLCKVTTVSLCHPSQMCSIVGGQIVQLVEHCGVPVLCVAFSPFLYMFYEPTPRDDRQKCLLGDVDTGLICFQCVTAHVSKSVLISIDQSTQWEIQRAWVVQIPICLVAFLSNWQVYIFDFILLVFFFCVFSYPATLMSCPSLPLANLNYCLQLPVDNCVPGYQLATTTTTQPETIQPETTTQPQTTSTQPQTTTQPGMLQQIKNVFWV